MENVLPQDFIETESLVDNDLEWFAQRDGIRLRPLRDIAVKRRGSFYYACMMTSGEMSNHYGTIQASGPDCSQAGTPPRIIASCVESICTRSSSGTPQ